jgi:hypothetical protein
MMDRTSVGVIHVTPCFTKEKIKALFALIQSAIGYICLTLTKHRTLLSPNKSPYLQGGPELVPITGFTDTKKKKKPRVFDREDSKMMKRAGFSIIDEWNWPD